MHPEERNKIEAELRANGFIHVDGVPFTEKQIALLTWHKLDELSAAVARLENQSCVSHDEIDAMFDRVRKHFFTSIGAIVSVGGLVVAIISVTH